MEAALGQRINWSESRRGMNGGERVITLDSKMYAVYLFIPRGSSASFLLVSVFNLKSKRPTNNAMSKAGFWSHCCKQD